MNERRGASCQAERTPLGMAIRLSKAKARQGSLVPTARAGRCTVIILVA